LDKDVDLKIDITGSEGATFEGSYSTVKEVKVHPHSDNVHLADVRLFGDWLLRIRFTYTIEGLNYAPQIPAELLAEPLQGDKLSTHLAKAREVFGKVPYDILPLDEIRKSMRQSGIENFIDIEFPPVEASIYNTLELGIKPFAKERIVWKRPVEFMKVDECNGLLPP
jgi:hypothetical protein